MLRCFQYAQIDTRTQTHTHFHFTKLQINNFTSWATRETLQINATVLYALLSAQSSSRVNMLYSPAQQLMFSEL